MKDFSFLDFIRDIGKHITVNYMMAKDSVKKRLGEEAKMGLSYTEFSYQLVQGTDFLHLYREKNCKLQMGGSDQWGNITTGTELIRRKEGGEAFALTCPLITKADGGKFGKTESGNVWLDPKLTTPYKFYQFWLNVSDADAEKYIKIFTLLTQEEVAALVEEQQAAPHLRPLQKRLAQEVTCMVHDEDEYNKAVEASEILFGKATTESLARLDKETFLSVFEGVSTFEVDRAKFDTGVPIVELLAAETAAFPSKGELRRMIKGNGLSLNQAKLTDQEYLVTGADLINGSYILVQKGKKNYYIIEAV
jgi:tyrosyl-tRNA synthetase